MCGLCGSFTQKGVVLSKRDKTQRARVLEGLLVANQVRGTDSTGVAAIGYDGKFDVLKVAVDSWKFVNRNDVQQILRTDAPLMIGHTRMTSMGNDVRDENAHPFVEGNVIGAHNGIINNYTQLDSSVRVDSQAVFRELDKHPDAYDYVFPRVSGSCTLTWWDARDPEAMCLVAHMNPLSVAIVPRIQTVFWSSQLEHLESITRAAYGTGVDFMTVKRDTIYRIPAENVYEWQEAEVDFGTEARFGSQIRVYSSGGYGWSDDEEREIAEYYGYGAGKGTSSPKVNASSSGALLTETKPEAMSPEEEARYEAFWNNLMDPNFQRRNESDLDENESERPSSSERLHELSAEEYEQVAADRFEVDDLDGTLDCGYCDKPLGDKGVWDNGLQLMLCRFCQKWWDDYGHYANKDGESAGQVKSYPLATT